MLYYLSYIEINGHSAFMLSEQDNLSSPTKIISEIGLRLSPNIDEIGYFTKHKGYVREEESLSRLLYSHGSSMKHKTYEISQEELMLFFSIINEDRRKNAAPVTVGWEIKIVGGPEYQLLSYNCKTYAMEVLKKLGIIDAKQLNNFFIQRTGTTDSALEKISKNQFSCPLKDKFIQDIDAATLELINKLSIIKENKNEIQSASHEEYFDKIDKALMLAKIVKENAHKVAIDNGFPNNYKKLLELSNDMAHFSIPGFDLIEDCELTMDKLFDLEKTMDQIKSLTLENELEFFWKTTPNISQRMNFDKFTELEKAIHTTRIKSQELSDGLYLLNNLIAKEVFFQKNPDPNLESDLTSLNKFILEAQKALDLKNKVFLTSLQSTSEPFVLQACLDQTIESEAILKNLESKIAGFEAKSKKTHPFLRFISRLLNYFNQDYKGLDLDVKGVLKKELVKLQNKSEIKDFSKKKRKPKRQ